MKIESRPHIEFHVHPSRFSIGTPITARCSIRSFKPEGRNFEVTFYRSVQTNPFMTYHGGIPETKVPIGSYIVVNGYSNWRPRLMETHSMTVSSVNRVMFPDYEIIIVPKTNESRATYGCFLNTDLSITDNYMYLSNTWNANGIISHMAQSGASIIIQLILVIIASFVSFF